MSDTAVLSEVTPLEIRSQLEELVRKDLLGPAGGPEEELDWREDRVRERYLIGVLAPRRTLLEPVQPDELSTAELDDEEAGTAESASLPTDTFFPNSFGLSFVVESSAQAILVKTEWGRYRRVRSEIQQMKDGSAPLVWKREPVAGEPQRIPLKEGDFGPLVPRPNDPYVVLRGRIRRRPNGWVVTLFMENTQDEPDRKKDEAWVFQPKMWVTGASGQGEPVFVCRRSWNLDGNRLDTETRQEMEMLEMLYRHQVEFAVGHGVAVHVTKDETDPQRAVMLETEFLPRFEVEQQTTPTGEDNQDLAALVLDMKELAELPREELLHNLRRIETAYSHWIQNERRKLTDPGERLEAHQEAADKAIAACERARDRIREGIELIASSAEAERAFRFANRAMWQQRIHSIYARKVRKKQMAPGETLESLDRPENRSWRLFQLAFVLLNLPSLSDLHHPERSGDDQTAVADLLWFATGGGKTEAYLGLTAYTLALRRRQGDVGGRAGDHGVGVLMRYTLRLLTLQQFQRAAALICACESIRKSETAVWGTTPFRLGLWVGSKSTPNTLAQAAEALRQANGGGRPTMSGTPHQLVSCPWCGTGIKEHHMRVYEAPGDIGRCVTYCGDPLGRCEFSEAKAPKEGLPVMVVDEEIYRRPPSLLIATVDKFAQMPWKGQVQMLFGRVNGLCPRHGFLSPEIDDTGNHPKRYGLEGTRRLPHGPLRPPDLIIQDELHLISGPLGSMVALYECAVDELCSWDVDGKKIRPKVIASTATIRRARDQVKKIFLRKLEVFPPQGTNLRDSFFALQRPAGEKHPGRCYMGVCAFGRRYPATVIRIYTTLMAAAQKLYEDYDSKADPWMTLAGYFNSIRELAGTRRLVEADIRARLRDMDQRGLSKRRLRFGAVEELTSRKSGTDIPRILERLEVAFNRAREAELEGDRKAGHQAGHQTGQVPYDVILATNMISVGVDIDRLGLMVVAGQPKTTSEYIQATSRVGRDRRGPGLVLTIYNWARPRDLSHFESFEHYHETFYKHVEALSVTPFAPRALDRGLSGVLVALMRLLDDRLNGNKTAGELQDNDPLMLRVIDQLGARAEAALEDSSAGTLVRQMLMERRDQWLSRVHRQVAHCLGYESAGLGVVGLLNKPEAGGWQLFTCLNSLRDVEGTVDLLLDKSPTGLRVEI